MQSKWSKDTDGPWQSHTSSVPACNRKPAPGHWPAYLEEQQSLSECERESLEWSKTHTHNLCWLCTIMHMHATVCCVHSHHSCRKYIMFSTHLEVYDVHTECSLPAEVWDFFSSLSITNVILSVWFQSQRKLPVLQYIIAMVPLNCSTGFLSLSQYTCMWSKQINQPKHVSANF